MPSERILATAPIAQAPTEILQAVAPVEVSPDTDEETLLARLDGTIGIVARGVEAKITSRIIDSAPSLRVVGRPGAGFDTVDVEAATRRKVAVIIAPVGGFAVAEGALALLLAAIKRIPFCDQLVKQGEWKRRYEFFTGDLTEQTLGIVGLGRIGQGLARLVQPFETRILGYDPMVTPEAAAEMGITLVGLDELLSESHFVSLHVPLMPETKGLMNRQRISRMRRGAILINTARGGIIESLDVLAEALESGQLGAVGLDVFPDEPPDSSHRLFRDPRVICAPHMLGVSELAMDRIFKSMARDMVAVLRGERPTYCVNPEVLGP